MQNEVNPILQRRKKVAILRRTRFGFFKKLVVIGLIGIAVMTQVFGINTVHGVDMNPSVKDGDIVIFFRINNKYTNGDVVVYDHKDKAYISRIGATEGDILKKGTNGQLVFNDRLHPINKEEGLFYLTKVKKDISYPIKVKKDEYFVLGDKRDTAKDSRNFGCIKKKEIKGKVFCVIRKRGV